MSDNIIDELHQILLSYFKDNNRFEYFWNFIQQAGEITEEFNKNSKVYIKLLDCLENEANNQTIIHHECSPECPLACVDPINSECGNYMKIKHCNVAPQLLQYGFITIPNIIRNELCEDNVIIDKHISAHIKYMIIEKHGQSLFNKYAGVIDFDDNLLGPGLVSEELLFSAGIFATAFPSFIPADIRTQVYDIVWLLYQNNIRLNDIHLGNFVEKDGLVKVIDLEDITLIEHDPDLLVNNSLVKVVKILYLGVSKYWDSTLIVEAYKNGARDVTPALLAMIDLNGGVLYDTIEDTYKFLIQCGASIEAAITEIKSSIANNERQIKLIEFLQSHN